ncbi:MAG: protein phosphatase 2C domain-containing protein [Gemmatimonadota bacterium]
MNLSAFGASDVGKRRARNEDSLVVRPDLRLFAVADGMGGHAAGDVASRTAIEALLTAMAAASLEAAIQSANRAVWESSQEHPVRAGMGTTLTAVRFEQEAELVCGHVGDSRLYRMRDGMLEQLTRDHSIPRTSMLTRAVGTQPVVEVDVFRASVMPGDRYLLCSDGLTGMVSEEDLRVLIAQRKQLEVICGDLIDAANLHGGIDNITAILIEAS